MVPKVSENQPKIGGHFETLNYVKDIFGNLYIKFTGVPSESKSIERLYHM